MHDMLKNKQSNLKYRQMNKRLAWNFEINDDTSIQLPDPQVIEQHEIRWEARFFWSSDDIITLHGLNDGYLELSRYKAKHRHDIYCLLPTENYNLKIRHEQLIYKPLLTTTPQALGFGNKINLEEQASPQFLPGINNMNTTTLLEKIQQDGCRIQVEKEALIYRFDTTPKSTIELARLTINTISYFSANIESRSMVLVKSITQQIIGKRITCDYVNFLKGL